MLLKTLKDRRILALSREQGGGEPDGSPVPTVLQRAWVALLALGLGAATGAPAAAFHIPVLNEATKLVASDGKANDWFGHSVALDGDTVVVSAIAGNQPSDRPVYVFDRTADGLWVEVAQLIASDDEDRRGFGESVSLHRDTIVVGAHVDDDLGEDAGATYLFERSDEGAWAQAAKLYASDGETQDRFGESVAVDGDTVVVGAEFQDDLGDGSGVAYVFERTPEGAWMETATLLASDGQAADAFGCSVAISGDRILVGARGDDDRGSAAGAVYVFEKNDADLWLETSKLLASDGEVGDGFGGSVAIDGNVVAVGALASDDQGISSGSAYVFERAEDGSWEETAKLLSPHGAMFDSFGYVAVSGETLVVGASEGQNEAGLSSGTADLFRREGEEWVSVARLFASDGQSLDQFGRAVAIDGDTVVVGARLDDLSRGGTDAGSAYVFSLADCVLQLRLDPPAVRPGEELRVGLALEHNRSQTVTVPFRVWIEDAAGGLITSRTTEPLTFRHGETLRREVALPIPSGAPAGRYRVLAGVERMRQDLAAAVAPFWVVESSVPPPPR